MGQGNKIDLGTLGGKGSYANAINNAGKVIGYLDISSSNYRAVLWDKGKR
jgi:probable HAF family extracellular repeat protein